MKSRQLKRTKFALLRRVKNPPELQKQTDLRHTITATQGQGNNGQRMANWRRRIVPQQYTAQQAMQQYSTTNRLPFKAGGHRRAASAVPDVATSLLSGTA